MNPSHYVDRITEMLQQCNDLDLLDLIYKILLAESNSGLLLNETGYQAAEVV